MDFHIDSEKCIRCGFCVEACPLRIIEIQDKQPPVWTDNADQICLNCGHCVAVCPESAVSLSTMAPIQCPKVQQDLIPNYEQMTHSFKCRRSIRAFNHQRPAKESLEKLIADANYSATGSNKQQVYWLVVVDRDVGKLAEITAKFMRSLNTKGPQYTNHILNEWDSGVDVFCRNAPAVLIAHGPGRNVDCLLAMTQLSLLAPSIGLGTCWAGFVMAAAANSDVMKAFLDLPTGHDCHGAIMIGYPKFKYSRLPLRNDPKIRWR